MNRRTWYIWWPRRNKRSLHSVSDPLSIWNCLRIVLQNFWEELTERKCQSEIALELSSNDSCRQKGSKLEFSWKMAENHFGILKRAKRKKRSHFDCFGGTKSGTSAQNPRCLEIPMFLLWSLQIVHLNCSWRIVLGCPVLRKKRRLSLLSQVESFCGNLILKSLFLFRFLSTRFIAASPSLAINVSRRKKSCLLWRLELKYFLMSSGCTREYWQRRPVLLWEVSWDGFDF